jgi:hypothetical protein
MKLGFKSIVLALSVALLCVPAAMAKNGNGHGKPSWAGGGSEKSHGKPAWAGVGKGKDHAKHEKVKPDKAKHQRAGAEDAAADEEVNLDDLNPAWYCFTLESMMDAADADAVAGGAESGEFSSFDSKFGTNDNKRNSHGQCVSRRAHGEDLSGALDESQQSCDPAAGSDEEGTDEGSTSEGPPTDDGSDGSTADDGTVDDGTADDGTTTDDGTADDGTADEGTTTDDGTEAGSDDESGDAEDCASDDSADEDQDDQADDEGDATDAAGFARALVRFIRL